MTAFLALWNDLRRGREAEYDEWHTREHVPERVACPGFRRGRRYACADHPTHRWFTLYEVDDLSAFDTPAYRELIDRPTPWSASMRPDFRHFLRAPCTGIGDAGFGMGAGLAVLRLPDEAALPALTALSVLPGMVRARLGRRAPATDAHRIGSGDSGASDDFASVLLLEALDRGAAQHAFANAAARFGAEAACGGVYDLVFVFPAEPREREAHRRN